MDTSESAENEERQSKQTAEGASEAVLLYYKYVSLGEERRAAVQDWYLKSCGAEGLRGRWGGRPLLDIVVAYVAP